MLRQLANSTHTQVIKTGSNMKTLEHFDLNSGSAPSPQTTYVHLQLHHSISKEIYCKYAHKSKDKAESSPKDYISVFKLSNLLHSICLWQKPSLDSFKSNLKTFSETIDLPCFLFRTAIFLHLKSLSVV